MSIRELYTNQFAHLVACGGGLSEVALRDSKGQPIREGALALPMRLDLVSISGGVPQSRSVDPEMLMRFEPVEFIAHTGLRVRLYPFQWDDVAFSFADPGSEPDWRPLLDWFAEWYREEDDGAGELLGVVHFLSEPEVTDGSVRFRADLGSAPVEAFDALLDAIAALGVTHVVVGYGPRD